MKGFKSFIVLSVLFISAVLFCPDTVFGQEILKQFETPSLDARGLAWDGQHLWCSDVFSQKVYQLDPNNGNVISSFDFHIEYQFGGLAWGADGHLWLTDYRNQSWFFKIDPATGAIVSSFHCPGA